MIFPALLLLATATGAPDLSKVRPGAWDFERLSCAGASELLRERSRLEVTFSGVQLSVSTASAGEPCRPGFPTHPQALEWKDERTEVYRSAGRSGRFESDAGSFWWSCAEKKLEVHSPDVAFPPCDGGAARPASYAPRQLSGLACVTSKQQTLFSLTDAGVQTVAGACGEAVRLLTRARLPRTPLNLRPDLSALAPGTYSFERMSCDAAPETVHFGRATLEVDDAGVRLTRTRSQTRASCGKGFPELVRFESGATVVESKGRTGVFEWADAKGVEGKELWRCEPSSEVVHSREVDLIQPPLPKAKKPAPCPAPLDLTARSKTQQRLSGIRCETAGNELWFWAPDAGVIETVRKESPCGVGEAFRFAP